MKTSALIAIAFICASAAASIVYNGQDVMYYGSSSGSGCVHKADYTLRVGVFEGMMVGFPTLGWNRLDVQKVYFNIKPTGCHRGEVVKVYLYSTDDNYVLDEENCQTNTQDLLGIIRMDAQCNQIGQFDVTDVIKAGFAANRDQISFSISGGIDDDVDFNSCQRQEDGTYGCSLLLDGNDKPTSSFYLTVVVAGDAPSSVAPSTVVPAPTTKAPTTAPSTTAPATVVPSSSVAPSTAPSTSGPSTSAPSTSAPGSSVAPSTAPTTVKPTTKAPSMSPSTSTPSPTAGNNLSGDNNARASDAAAITGFSALLIATLFMLV